MKGGILLNIHCGFNGPLPIIKYYVKSSISFVFVTRPATQLYVLRFMHRIILF